MSQTVSATSHLFRKAFDFGSKQIQWFPGHMFKGMKVMEFKLKSVDCIIEVHDARIPFTGRNPNFNRTITGVKPHILILNKKDLADVDNNQAIINKIKKHANIQEILFTDFKNPKDVGTKKVLPIVKRLIESSDRYNRKDVKEYAVMIIGVPNVGKSSLINVLRSTNLNKRTAAAVGGVAGVTRSVSERIRVSDEPKIYLIDTPGILAPKIKDKECGMRLALCNTLQDHLIGETFIVDYLLFILNKQKNFSYVPFCGMDKPSDNITEVLLQTALHNNMMTKIKTEEGRWMKRPDFTRASIYLLKEFRKGGFGKVLLDDPEQDDVT